MPRSHARFPSPSYSSKASNSCPDRKRCPLTALKQAVADLGCNRAIVDKGAALHDQRGHEIWMETLTTPATTKIAGNHQPSRRTCAKFFQLLLWVALELALAVKPRISPPVQVEGVPERLSKGTQFPCTQETIKHLQIRRSLINDMLTSWCWPHGEVTSGCRRHRQRNVKPDTQYFEQTTAATTHEVALLVGANSREIPECRHREVRLRSTSPSRSARRSKRDGTLCNDRLPQRH